MEETRRGENAVTYSCPREDPLSTFERWGVGPGMHLGNTIQLVLSASIDPDDTRALDDALTWLARAVDSFPEVPLTVTPAQFEATMLAWAVPERLAGALRFLVDGKWKLAHLILRTEHDSRLARRSTTTSAHATV